MPIGSLFKISQKDRHDFCTKLIDSSSPRTEFYFLVILSTLIVALGLMADNVILVIGGMLVTPLLSPILAISLGIVISDHKVIMRSVRIFLVSFILAFLTALILGFFSYKNVGDISIIKVIKPSLFTFFISVIAGLAASYTWVKPTLNETLPGIAITVTLIPPLTAIGLAVADQDWVVFGDVIKVLFLNIFGIIITGILVFSLMDFYKAKKKVKEEIEEEAVEIQKEKEKSEKS